jgi:predicted O-methyltransferase YrrM
VDATVRAVVDELVAAADRHDAGVADRLARWRVLDPAAGEFLGFLARAVGARRIVEVGTSRGVSTLWLADAARDTDGHVLSVDTDPAAQDDARRALARAGLADRVTLRVQDGGAALAGLEDGAVDLLFLDAERTEYASWWPHPVRILRPGGVLVADNALSHPAEIAPLHALLAGDGRVATVATLEIGKGELVAPRGRGTLGA